MISGDFAEGELVPFEMEYDALATTCNSEYAVRRVVTPEKQ